MAPPGPAAVAATSFSTKLSRTAFFIQPLVDNPLAAISSATHASPESKVFRAAFTASRTSPSVTEAESPVPPHGVDGRFEARQITPALPGPCSNVVEWPPGTNRQRP